MNYTESYLKHNTYLTPIIYMLYGWFLLLYQHITHIVL